MRKLLLTTEQSSLAGIPNATIIHSALTSSADKFRRASSQRASSASSSGSRLISLSRLYAAPLGTLRPCSHSCSVRMDTPVARANSDCDRPDCARAAISCHAALPAPPAFPACRQHSLRCGARCHRSMAQTWSCVSIGRPSFRAPTAAVRRRYRARHRIDCLCLSKTI